MDTTSIKKEIMHDIDTLTENDLNDVFKFIRFIKNKYDIDPTLEILENDEFLKDINEGLSDKKAGKVYNWDDVK